MAQLVEHVIGNDEVISSTLIASSKSTLCFLQGVLFVFLVSVDNRHFLRYNRKAIYTHPILKKAV